MKRFNKNKAIKKLSNRNNNKTKIISASVSTVILIVAIIYFSFARFESTASYNLITGTVTSKYKTISQTMLKLISQESEDLGYDGTSTLGQYGTEDNNLRYIGADPSNYIYFNCSTSDISKMNSATCEKWRIVGLFNNIEDENGNKSSRIKIIKDEILTAADSEYNAYAWDSSAESVNIGFGINQWGESTYEDGTTYEGADLMRELNTDYLGNTTVGTNGKWYDSTNNSKNEVMPKTLNSNAQNMIQTIKWNTGSNEPNSSNNIYAKNLYQWERSNNTGKVCTDSGSKHCSDTVVRTTSWIGKVGLIYPSDYAYATYNGNADDRLNCLSLKIAKWYNEGSSEGRDCSINSWIRDVNFPIFTLTAYSDGDESYNSYEAYGVFRIDNRGHIIDNASYYVSGDHAAQTYGIKPVVYLKDNIRIVDGKGTSSSPYKLAID